MLGHHREDVLETFFMNLFHGGRLAAMPPKLLNDEGDVTVLRPLALCAEADLARFAEAMKFPIIPCDLCGSQDGLQRNAMKAMLDEMERKMPGRKETMIRALANVRPSHLLDPKLFDFAGARARRQPPSPGDVRMTFDDQADRLAGRPARRNRHARDHDPLPPPGDAATSARRRRRPIW